MVDDKIKLMKKNLVKILLIAGFMSFAVAFASVDDFKNNVFKLDLYKTNADSVNAVIYTTLPYSSPINVIKKSDTEYTILMPEVKSSLVQTPNLKSVSDLIEKVEIKTQPYSQTPALNGYTKLSFTTLKPLNITTSIQVLKLPDIQVNSVSTFLDNLDKKAEAPKPIIVAKPTEVSKSKVEPAKTVAVKSPVVKPVVVSKPASPARVVQKISKPKPVQKVSQPVRRVARAVEPVRPVKKVQPIKPVAPKPVQKVEPAPTVQIEPTVAPEPVVEETIPTEETVTTEEAPAPEVVEETPAEEEYVEEEYTEEPQPNNLGNILLIVGIVFGVGALASVFLLYAKKLKQEGERQAAIDQPDISVEIPLESNYSQENFENQQEDFGNLQDEFELPQDEFELPQEPENIQGFTSEEFIQEKDDIVEDFSQQAFEIPEIIEDDFIIEEPEAPLTKEDIHEMYNEGFQEMAPEIVDDIQDNDFIIENDWGDEFEIISETEQPKKSIDDLFSGYEKIVDEIIQEQIQPETTQVAEIIEEPQIQPEPQVVIQPEVQPEIQSEILPQENNLGFDIKSSFKIDEAKAMHLIELDGKTSLIGTMNDDVFVLKTFDTLIENPIQSRLYENMADKNVYMVKAGKFKGLIDVSKKAMELAVEL